jgi:Lamin Tail Domain/Secretion system C-terminal sorting domain/Calx-beta domain
MRKILLVTLLFAISVVSYGQLTQGSIAFVGYNADGNDNIAFVALTTISSGETIIFEDNEWNGTAWVDTNEGAFSWTATSSVAPGTIVLIDNIGTGTIIASTGTAISAATLTPSRGTNRGIGGGDETIYAYQGSFTSPTFIAAIASGGFSAANGLLTNTGLSEGVNAISFLSTDDDTDIAAYNGSRIDQTSFAAYLSPINNPGNWITQDATGDQSIDLVAPDLPFSSTPFTLSAGDNTPPTVSTVILVGNSSIEVTFSESVTLVSAQTLANYTISGSATINSVSYSDVTKKATLTTSTLQDGIGYTISVSDISDLAGNVMSATFNSSTLIFNNTTPPLIITEIMYNALNVPEADALEFIEIYNNSANVVQAGGLRIKDANNFNFTLPQTTIPANGFLLLATDKTGAEAFYTGATFLDLPVTGNVLSNGGELIELLNSSNIVVDAVNYDDVAPWPIDADERGYSLELYNLTLDNNVGQNWGVPSTFVKKLNGVDIFATPGSFAPTASPLAFSSDKTNTTETGGTLSISVSIAFSSSVEVSTLVSVIGGTAVAGTDYNFANQTVTFPANSTAQQSISLAILDNTVASQDKYLVLQIGTVTNGSLGSVRQHIVFIKDNDRLPIAPSNALSLTFAGNFKVPEAGSSAEISAFDPGTDRLFVVNSLLNKMEILNLANPAAITRISTIDMAPYGAGLNSIAVKNGLVAVAVENATTTNGKVAFFDTNGVHLKSVDAGNLPDMVTFTPDGKFVLTANEAQPIFYTPTLSDPEGSITIVDLSSVVIPADVANLTQANVTQINFNAFDSQLATLKSQGVRIFGPGSSVSQDLEPEFITVSADSKKAWVTLQENNAIAIIDLVSKTVTDIRPLGFKDHSLPENSFDASDVSGDIFFGNWKVRGLYMPDAIASYEVAGVPYVITANEGDAREYTGITDEVTFASLNLDPIAFPDASVLKNNSALGRLLVTNKNGDTDGDGDFDEVYSFGARSFTIWNGNTGARVFDSGNQLERITSEDPTWSPFFNANNSTGTPARKNRSDNKGPEPEGVAVAEINGKQYAFIGLERIGGVVTYDVTNPSAPIFVGYDNNRSNPVSATSDLGTEGVTYISAADSPTGTALVLLSNEISATVSVYTVDGILNVNATTATAATSISATGFTANWTAATGATGYQLDISSDNFATFVTGYNSKLVSGTSEVVSGLVANTTYQYRVRVVNGINNSVASNVIAALTLKQNQTITFTTPVDKVVGDVPFMLSASSTSGLAVTFSSASDKITISGTQVTIVKAGRASITASQLGNNQFNAATPVERNFCIKPVKPTVTISNANTEAPTLTSSATAGNQWFLNGNAISGATNATLNAVSAGVYKVQVKVDDCVSDFSADATLIVTGDLPAASSSLSAYPNPADDFLQIDGVNEVTSVYLVDATGRERAVNIERSAQGYRVDVRELPNGLYFLRLSNSSTVYQLKFIKK